MATKQKLDSKGGPKQQSGQGVSKPIQTSAEQAAIKHAAQARRARSRDASVRFTKDTGIYAAVVHPSRPIVLTTRKERAMAELLNKNKLLSEVPTQKSEPTDKLLADFITEFGSLVISSVVKSAWSSQVRLLVSEYIYSLVKGDGSQPTGLNSSIAGHMRNLFCGTCFRMIVGTDVLPGQRQAWYQSMFVKEPTSVS